MKEYTVEVNGIEHTLMLSDEDAKARGLSAKVVKPSGVEDKAVKRAESKKRP